VLRIHAVAAVAAFACAASSPAYAQNVDELNRIREEIRSLKEDYESRIRALERRLGDAEARAVQAEARAGEAQSRAQAAQATAQEAGQAAASSADRQSRASAFNPAISLILQGRYANLSQDPDTYRIGGFVPSGGEVSPGPRGFSLAESELWLSAAADPYFSGQLTAALTPENEVEVENAYLQTLALGHGFTVKGGRFFSGVGYLNEQHQHAWDFIDAPLPYRAFLGRQLGDDGVQVKWVAPTELFLEIGGEAGRGREFPASDRNKNGVGLATAFAHVGGDLGASHSWRAGVSYVWTSADGRTYEDLDSTGATVTNAYSGPSRLWIADFVWKWAPNGNPTSRNFKFQAEYFHRTEDGTLVFDQDAAATGPVPGSYSSRQSGWYAQAVYQFMPRWRTGLRYDRLDSGSTSIGAVQTGTLTPADFPILASYRPTIATAMVDWSPTEFSRLRLQYAQDKSRPDATDQQIFVQYILSLGAHGAHKW
jgi:hypothetical protein